MAAERAEPECLLRMFDDVNPARIHLLFPL